MPPALRDIPPLAVGTPLRQWLAEYRVVSPDQQEMMAWAERARQERGQIEVRLKDQKAELSRERKRKK